MSVLEGATLIVQVDHKVTDDEVLGALGKRVTSKVARIWVTRMTPDGLTVGRVIGER